MIVSQVVDGGNDHALNNIQTNQFLWSLIIPKVTNADD